MNPDNNSIVMVGFKEKNKIVEVIDKLAEEEGLNRSNYLRHVVREKIKQAGM